VAPDAAPAVAVHIIAIGACEVSSLFYPRHLRPRPDAYVSDYSPVVFPVGFHFRDSCSVVFLNLTCAV